MITTPTVSGKPGQAPTGLSCDLYPLITAPGPILGVPSEARDQRSRGPDQECLVTVRHPVGRCPGRRDCRMRHRISV
jgi:hypothetical protein